MLKLTVVGRIGKDAVMRYANNKNVISFPIAHNEKFTDKDGVKHEKTTWIDCSIWKDKETNLAQYLTKGQWVYLEGNPIADVYQKDDELVPTMKLNVRRLEMVGNKKPQSQPTTQTAPATPEADPTASW